MADRHDIFCDCCGKEKLAERREDGAVVVKIKRHGRPHVVVVTPAELDNEPQDVVQVEEQDT